MQNFGLYTYTREHDFPHAAQRSAVARSNMKRMSGARKHVGESRAHKTNNHADVTNMSPARSTMQQRSDNDATRRTHFMQQPHENAETYSKHI